MEAVLHRFLLPLKDLLTGFIYRKWAQGEPRGLSRATYGCLDTLKFIHKAIEKKQNDPLAEKKNVAAIMNAYRMCKLEWIKGLVTYWSDGKQLCEPRPIDWDEFEATNQAHSGHKAFWVEGMRKR